MKHFLKIFEGIDVLPLLAAIRMRDHLWNQNNLRTTHPGPAHSEADDIWLRHNELTQDGDTAELTGLELWMIQSREKSPPSIPLSGVSPSKAHFGL